MKNWIAHLRKNSFRVYSLALLLMLAPGLALYWAAQSGWPALWWILLALFAAGNGLALLLR